MSGFLQAVVIYTIPILLILTLIVTVHELGHFLMAKSFKVAIDRFSIGFGKAIARWTDKSGVEWRIGMIPLGGYVRFSGDTNDASVPDKEDLAELRRQIEERLGAEAVSQFYAFKPVWQRAMIAVAGPAANFLLAIAIYAALFMSLGEHRQLPRIGQVEPGSPAAVAGFQPGDLILTANGRTIRDFDDDFRPFVSLRAGEEVRIVVRRGDEVLDLRPTLHRKALSNGITKALVPQGYIGLGPDVTAREIIRYNPLEAIGEGARMTWSRIDFTLTYLGRIFRGHENGDQLSGIVGMANVSGAITKAAAQEAPNAGVFALLASLNLIQIAAAISIGIGFVNLLPIPMLDGGHLVFYAYEAIARRPVQARVQAASYRVGLALVLGLMLFATWNDLQRLQVFQFLGGMFS
jgi:regulator of sigma E protease